MTKADKMFDYIIKAKMSSIKQLTRNQLIQLSRELLEEQLNELTVTDLHFEYLKVQNLQKK